MGLTSSHPGAGAGRSDGMFEELKRLFTADAPPRDGLTGGDASLLDVLDLGLLRSEARAGHAASRCVRRPPPPAPAPGIPPSDAWRPPVYGANWPAEPATRSPCATPRSAPRR